MAIQLFIIIIKITHLASQLLNELSVSTKGSVQLLHLPAVHHLLNDDNDDDDDDDDDDNDVVQDDDGNGYSKDNDDDNDGLFNVFSTFSEMCITCFMMIMILTMTMIITIAMMTV